MIIAAALFSAALPAALDARPVVTFYEQAQLRGDLLHLSDAADLSALPDAVHRQAETLILGRYTRSQGVSARVMLGRVRAMMPLLSQWLPTRADGTIQLQSDKAGPSPVPRQSCLTVTKPVQAGQIAAGRYFTYGPCHGPYRSAVFRYDRSRQAIVTRRDLAQGDIVRAFPGAEGNSVQPGERLTLRAGAGPVIVERQVEALQGARPGQRLFVKTDDGTVIAIPLMDQAR